MDFALYELAHLDCTAARSITSKSAPSYDFLFPGQGTPPKGSRGGNKNGGAQKKIKRGNSLKDVDVSGSEVLSDENAQPSDRTEEVAVGDGENVAADDQRPLQEEGRMRRGFRRVLTSVSGLCKRLSTLILKVVKTIFPWNRRAKRRLAGEDAEEEL